LSLFTPKSAAQRWVCPILSLAHHGLASEARSTACALCHPRARPRTMAPPSPFASKSHWTWPRNHRSNESSIWAVKPRSGLACRRRHSRGHALWYKSDRGIRDRWLRLR